MEFKQISKHHTMTNMRLLKNIMCRRYFLAKVKIAVTRLLSIDTNQGDHTSHQSSSAIRSLQLCRFLRNGM